MDNLLIMREQFKELYRQHGTIMMVALKFVTVLVAMFLLSSKIGTMDLLTSPLVIVAVSAVCAVLPWGLSVVVLALVALAHIYMLSLEMAGFVLVVLMIMFMLFFRFSSGDSFVLVLMPVLFVLKIPFVIPIALGLFATPFSVVTVMFSVVVYFLLNYIHVNLDTLTGATDGLATMSAMANDVFTNQSMYLIIIAFSIVLVAVFIIRKLSVGYAWLIAVCAGTVVNMIILIIGQISFQLGAVISWPMLIVGSIVSFLIATGLCFMFHYVDYAKTENVQFEDDNYYYYVKAIPKVKSNIPKSRRRTRR